MKYPLQHLEDESKWTFPCCSNDKTGNFLALKRLKRRSKQLFWKNQKKVTQQIAEDDNKNLQEYCYIINNFIVAIFLAQSHNISIRLWYTTTNCLKIILRGS